MGHIASGMVDLLLKAAAHPSTHICGIALEALSQIAIFDKNFPLRLLPVLQHRAIVPYVLNNGVPSLAASEFCGFDIEEFSSFRKTALAEALAACYKCSPDYYMNSCTVAVEEFCRASPTVKTSFQLEAALFCFVAVADESINAGQDLMTPETVAGNGSRDMTDTKTNQLSRCTELLGKKPISVTANPLTLAQACYFIGKVSWRYLAPSCNSLVYENTFSDRSSSRSFVAFQVVHCRRQRNGTAGCS